MSWSWGFSNSQRQRISIAFGGVLVIIMLASWFVSYTMQQVDSQFKSVYQDRLVPASYMSDIMERSYQNQLLLERHLQIQQSQEMDNIRTLWHTNTAAIDVVIQKFETTYLTDQEAMYLKEFKQSLEDLKQTQQQVMQLSDLNSKTAAQQVYQIQNQEQFEQILVPLHNMIKLQEEVGHDLYLSADRQVKSLKVLSYIVIAIAVIVTLLIGTLLQTNRKIKSIKPQKYQLN